MHILAFALAATAAMSLPAAASAQAAATVPATPALAVGTVIYDPQGGEVGKIDSVSGDAIVVDTGAHKATLPRSAFASGAKGPTVTITKAQIDEQMAAAAQKAAAALEAALVVGAEVKGKAGTPIGTVKEVSADKVVIDRPAGPVAIGRKAVGLGDKGLFISLTAQELDAVAKPATAAN